MVDEGADWKIGLPPIARRDVRLMILGSLPGDASLAAGRYYAHPANQFWRLLGGAIHEPALETRAYPERLALLAERRIGLWDVIDAGHRRGSLDQAIRSARANPLEDLAGPYPELCTVAFNGAAAARIGRRQLAGSALELIDLPSSSPANTTPIGLKAEAWAKLAGALA